MSQLTGPTRPATGADVLGPQLRDRVTDFRACEVAVRLDEPDAVHRFRVSARRLRSLLAAFEALLDPVPCLALDAELSRSASIVAAARGAEVAQRRLESLLGEQPDSLAVRTALARRWETTYAEGRRQAVTSFDGPGYDAFTRVLDGFADLPPWTPVAATPAKPVFVAVLRQEWTRLRKSGRRVQLLEAGPQRDHRLHDVRRAAKRVIDVAEAQASISGRKVRRLRQAAERLSAVLGEHHDVVTTAALLQATEADLAVGDVVQRVQRRETAAAEELYDEFVRVFEEADRKSLRAWMS